MAKPNPKTTLASTLFVAADVNEGLTPVIFLHDILCSKEIWEDIPQKVADETKRRVYAYDARDHGSSKHTGDFSINYTVRDLFGFMTEINAETAILVGHSLGGITAIRAALWKPARVEKVVSVEMYVKKIPGTLIDETFTFVEDWYAAVTALDESTELKDVTPMSVEKLYETLDDDMKLPAEKNAYLKGNFLYKKANGKYDMKCNVNALLEFLCQYRILEKIYYEELEKESTQYSGPAYFIYAARSHYKVSSDKENILKHFPKAQLVEIDGDAHLIFVEQPEVFTRELIKALKE